MKGYFIPVYFIKSRFKAVISHFEQYILIYFQLRKLFFIIPYIKAKLMRVGHLWLNELFVSIGRHRNRDYFFCLRLFLRNRIILYRHNLVFSFVCPVSMQSVQLIQIKILFIICRNHYYFYCFVLIQQQLLLTIITLNINHSSRFKGVFHSCRIILHGNA